MRIISKTQDFYDSALGLGEDRSVVYVRENRRAQGIEGGLAAELAKAPCASRFYGSSTGAYAIDDGFYPHVLLFCGKAYPFFEHDERSYASWPALGLQINHLWSAEDVHATIARRLPARAHADYDRVVQARIFTHAPFVRGMVEAFFGTRFDERAILDLHHRHRSPAILLGISRLDRKPFSEIDPVLKEIGFFRRLGPYETFQEISMFMGGVLNGSERPAARIADPMRFLKHGFDRWSFRRKAS